MSDDIAPLLGEGGPSAAGYHKVEAYMKCPKRHQYAMVRGIRLPMRETPAYFAVGSCVHAGRSNWLARGCGLDVETWGFMEKAVDKVLTDYEATGLPVAKVAREDSLRYLREYVDHWSMRPKPNVIATEYPVGPVTLFDGTDEVRTARVDDISFYPEGNNQLYIGECKTTSTDIGTAVLQYQLHGQPMLQKLLWDRARGGADLHGPVAGVMLDVIQKGYGGKKCQFARRPIEVTDIQLAWFAKSMAKIVAESKLVTWDSEVERRVSSCTEMVGTRRVACPFQSLCMHGRSAGLEFVTEDGKRLTEFQPTEERKAMPWE